MGDTGLLHYVCRNHSEAHSGDFCKHSGNELGGSFVNKSRNPIYYRRGGLYWKVFVDFETGSSEEKILKLRPELNNYAIIAALSSNLWFWYLMLTSDCRHLGNRDITTFPFDPRLMKPHFCEELSRLGEIHVEDLKANSENTIRVYKGKKAVKVISFSVKKSKSIIDQIDTLLAKHYGFTDEELDFIINYDIKYRLGSDLFDEVDA